LADIRLRIALKSVQEILGDRFRKLMQQCCVLKSSGTRFNVFDDLEPTVKSQYSDLKSMHKQVNAARATLKSMIFAEQPPSHDQYRKFQEDYPLLNYLSPSNFWTDFDTAAWVLGWNTGEAKHFRNVKSLVGWAFLSKRMENLIPQLMEERDSRHLLEVCIHIAEVTGHQCWWTHLLDFDADERPSPPSTPEDSGKKNNAGTLKRTPRGHPSKGTRKTNDMGEQERDNDMDPQHEPGSETLTGSEMDNQQNELQSDSGTITSEEGRQKHEPVRVNDSENAPSPRLLDNSMHSTPQLDMEDETTYPSIEQVEHQLSSGRSLSVVTDRHITDSQRGLQPGSQRELASSQAQVSSTLIQHAYTGNKEQRSQCSTTLRNGQLVSTLLNKRNPGHIMTLPWMSPNTLEAVQGCTLYDTSPSYTIQKAIELYDTRFEGIMFRINQERQKLRESLLIAAQHCVKAPYGGYFAEIGLASLNAQYKVGAVSW
jgi:hypothetical protein